MTSLFTICRTFSSLCLVLLSFQFSLILVLSLLAVPKLNDLLTTVISPQIDFEIDNVVRGFMFGYF